MRHYKRKTDRGQIPPDVMEAAAKLVLDNQGAKNFSVRRIAIQHKISFSTLHRYISKVKRARSQTNDPNLVSIGYAKPRRVFSDNLETILAAYLKRVSDSMFGLTPLEIRKLAYRCAVSAGIAFPKSWAEKECAGVEWYSSFMTRHKDMSIRRSKSSNSENCVPVTENVSLFFNKLSDVFTLRDIPPNRIWNMDEIGISSIINRNKTITSKEVEEFIPQRERMITITTAICADGNFLPPVFIFPRNRYRDYFMDNGTYDDIGIVNGSGWQTEDTFLEFMEHFTRHVKSSPETPVLLLLDNHPTHLTSAMLDICKINGIILLSFPPHYCHRMQPLSYIYRPFKKYIESTIKYWLSMNPKKALTVYNLLIIVKQAFLCTMSSANITTGFKKTGILPFHPEMFMGFQSSYILSQSRLDPTILNQNTIMAESELNFLDAMKIDNFNSSNVDSVLDESSPESRSTNNRTFSNSQNSNSSHENSLRMQTRAFSKHLSKDDDEGIVVNWKKKQFVKQRYKRNNCKAAKRNFNRDMSSSDENILLKIRHPTTERYKRPRNYNFTLQEKMHFLDCLKEYIEVTENRRLDTPAVLRKKQTWELLVAKYNDTLPRGPRRNYPQLKDLYRRMKIIARKVKNQRSMKFEPGETIIHADEPTERLIQMMSDLDESSSSIVHPSDFVNVQLVEQFQNSGNDGEEGDVATSDVAVGNVATDDVETGEDVKPVIGVDVPDYTVSNSTSTSSELATNSKLIQTVANGTSTNVVVVSTASSKPSNLILSNTNMKVNNPSPTVLFTTTTNQNPLCGTVQLPPDVLVTGLPIYATTSNLDVSNALPSTASLGKRNANRCNVVMVEPQRPAVQNTGLSTEQLNRELFIMAQKEHQMKMKVHEATLELLLLQKKKLEKEMKET